MTTFHELLSMQRKTRKSPSDEEHKIQTTCVKWFNITHPKLKGLLFAVPNGGRRDKVTAAKLKEEGVVAGVADLILAFGAVLILCFFTKAGRACFWTRAGFVGATFLLAGIVTVSFANVG